MIQYKNNQLFCEDVPVEALAAACGTPLYIYSAAMLRARFEQFRQAFSDWDSLVCFSVKSCGNLSIIKLLAEAGAGFDIVSGGELQRVVAAGGDPTRTAFAGVGKTRAEIELAFSHDVHLFDVESRPELEAIASVATAMGRRARIVLRVNPDVDAHTHAKTTTGTGDTKFGIGLREVKELFALADQWPSVDLCGLHVHLGSPIYSTEPYCTALDKIVPLIGEIRAAGGSVTHLNLGGGYCVSYTGEEVIGPEDYAAALRPYLDALGCRIVLEPGRYIAAPSAMLVSRIIYRKENEYGKRFLICDAAMNDLVRPAMYDSWQRIWPVTCAHPLPAVVAPKHQEWAGIATETVDVVGPVCETCDRMALGRNLPPTQSGDLLAIFDTGAYGFTMSSNYNARPRAAEVLVEGEQWRLIRRRESIAEMLAPEIELLRNME